MTDVCVSVVAYKREIALEYYVMPIRSIAFIGKRNEPLFLHTVHKEEDAAARLYEETIIHSSLDIFEERRGKKSGSTNTSATSADLFLGHILTVSRSKVYGFCSNTLTKIVVVCDINGPEEAVAKELTLAAYESFVKATKNPFQEVGKPVDSRGFSEDIKSMVSVFNTR